MAYPRNTSKTQNPHSKELNCLMECMSNCRACAKSCIEEGKKRLAMLCLDCSDICDLALKMRSCDSEYCQQVTDLCAQVCRNCASECDQFPSPICEQCAEACRRCAEACSTAPAYR